MASISENSNFETKVILYELRSTRSITDKDWSKDQELGDETDDEQKTESTPENDDECSDDSDKGEEIEYEWEQTSEGWTEVRISSYRIIAWNGVSNAVKWDINLYETEVAWTVLSNTFAQLVVYNTYHNQNDSDEAPTDHDDTDDVQSTTWGLSFSSEEALNQMDQIFTAFLPPAEDEDKDVLSAEGESNVIATEEGKEFIDGGIIAEEMEAGQEAEVEAEAEEEAIEQEEFFSQNDENYYVSAQNEENQNDLAVGGSPPVHFEQNVETVTNTDGTSNDGILSNEVKEEVAVPHGAQAKTVSHSLQEETAVSLPAMPSLPSTRTTGESQTTTKGKNTNHLDRNEFIRTEQKKRKSLESVKMKDQEGDMKNQKGHRRSFDFLSSSKTKTKTKTNKPNKKMKNQQAINTNKTKRLEPTMKGEGNKLKSKKNSQRRPSLLNSMLSSVTRRLSKKPSLKKTTFSFKDSKKKTKVTKDSSRTTKSKHSSATMDPKKKPSRLDLRRKIAKESHRAPPGLTLRGKKKNETFTVGNTKNDSHRKIKLLSPSTRGASSSKSPLKHKNSFRNLTSMMKNHSSRRQLSSSLRTQSFQSTESSTVPSCPPQTEEECQMIRERFLHRRSASSVSRESSESDRTLDYPLTDTNTNGTRFTGTEAITAGITGIETSIEHDGRSRFIDRSNMSISHRHQQNLSYSSGSPFGRSLHDFKLVQSEVEKATSTIFLQSNPMASASTTTASASSSSSANVKDETKAKADNSHSDGPVSLSSSFEFHKENHVDDV
eukprot:g713.t1